jgi:hypothetical protein
VDGGTHVRERRITAAGEHRSQRAALGSHRPAVGGEYAAVQPMQPLGANEVPNGLLGEAGGEQLSERDDAELAP